jgi:hypothetical protein
VLKLDCGWQSHDVSVAPDPGLEDCIEGPSVQKNRPRQACNNPRKFWGSSASCELVTLVAHRRMFEEIMDG